MNNRTLTTALRSLALVPLLGLGVIAVGCAAEQEEDTANVEGQVNASAPETLTLFEEHLGGRFEVQKGQEVQLHLPMTAGQSWEVVDDGDLAKPKLTPKSGGVVLTWRVGSEAGVVRLALKDADGKELRGFSFTLVVGASKVECPPQRTVNCIPKVNVPPLNICAREQREALEKACGTRFVL